MRPFPKIICVSCVYSLAGCYGFILCLDRLSFHYDDRTIFGVRLSAFALADYFFCNDSLNCVFDCL